MHKPVTSVKVVYTLDSPRSWKDLIIPITGQQILPYLGVKADYLFSLLKQFIESNTIITS